MAIIHEGFLRCPGCREYVVEADPEDYPDGIDYFTPEAADSKRKCGSCLVADGDAEEIDRSRRTIVADWDTILDSFGDSVSADMLPVVITVPATSRDEALQAAADKLQEHFGPDVAGLNLKGIERDWWFGFNDTDPLLRVSAVFIGCPSLDDEKDDTTTVIR